MDELFDEIPATQADTDKFGMVFKKPKPVITDEEVWLRAWCASVSIKDNGGPGDMAWYADKCLESFHARFRKSTPN